MKTLKFTFEIYLPLGWNITYLPHAETDTYTEKNMGLKCFYLENDQFVVVFKQDRTHDFAVFTRLGWLCLTSSVGEMAIFAKSSHSSWY